MSRSMLAAAAVAALAVSQAVNAQQKPGLIGDLLADVADAEMKITSLANALPDAAWDWRPGPGVRSSGEVIAHVAADNYFTPAMLGVPLPAATGIDAKNFQSLGAFERRQRTRAQAMADMAASFTFLKEQLGKTSEAQLGQQATAGQPTTRRMMWIGATTHLHEHLGQLIAYARVNKVVPPWSR